MTYDGNSLIISDGQSTAPQINAFMQARGQSLAAGYAPDGQYQKPPTQLGQAIIDECHRWVGMNGLIVNQDLVSGQIALSAGAQKPMMAMAVRATSMRNMRALSRATDHAAVMLFRPTLDRAMRVADEMQPRMLRLRHHLEVFRPIVGVVAVDVVDDLISSQISAKLCLGNQPMLGYALADTGCRMVRRVDVNIAAGHGTIGAHRDQSSRCRAGGVRSAARRSSFRIHKPILAYLEAA